MTNNELLQSLTVLLDQKFAEQDARFDQKFVEQDFRLKDFLDERFEANNQYLLNTILKEVDLVQKKTNLHFTRIEERLDRLEATMRTIKLDADTIPLLERRISHLEQRVDQIEEKIS